MEIMRKKVKVSINSDVSGNGGGGGGRGVGKKIAKAIISPERHLNKRFTETDFQLNFGSVAD